MKKNFLFASILAFTITLFSSCQGVIFDTIRDEVALDSAKLTGEISSIIRFKDYIFVCNGNVWCKQADSLINYWFKMPQPGNSNFTYKLAADDKYIYAQTMAIKEDEKEGENIPSFRSIYFSEDGITWKIAKIEGGVALTNLVYASYNPMKLMCTNTPQEAHRKAFLRYGYDIYELNGENAKMISSDDTYVDLSLVTNPFNPSQKLSISYSCTWFNGKYYFSGGYAMITNETKNTDATAMYYTSGNYIYTYRLQEGSNTNFTPVASNMNSGTIYSLGITADSILLGTSEGIAHTTFYENVPLATTYDFSTNAASALSSYYDVENILVVDPSLGEISGIIYGTTTFSGSSSSSSASFENIGLWSYYPYKGKWNLE